MKNNSASSKDISEWKGQDIILFQEDLRNQVKGSISEKSFYSYFKNSSEKVPRVDILNMLSNYCGYANWSEFKIQYSQVTTTNKKTTKRKWIVFLLIGILFITSAYFLIPKSNTFNFCFIDRDRNEPITKTPIEIIVLNNEQSPYYTKSDSLGCFTWQTKDDFIHFVIKSPYHKTDTIYRSIATARNENIRVSTDDYALMLHYYANGKLEDWKNRKLELSKMIADDAVIFQVLPSRLGIEVYSKIEFIDKLTTPIKSLQNIEIIESKRSKGQVVKLKFKVKS
ncbi:hypothetical protein [Aquimarina litoralis]|uniref:hypothetical protein n=1 Tax=Aquimarina litoralis TaxID=584605 RepID=UPI001C57189F|nr:hypothetical protein [Aquimarina litoralis]MBW1297276.1 hypothetical protein [Aquimarina litoralis]